MSFFVAALLHPEIQIRAQEEIDAVTGRVRLPTFDDRPRLPFIDAICKEVQRWRPVTPLGEFGTRRLIAHSKDFMIHRHTPRCHRG
jgi:cytochrome P450